VTRFGLFEQHVSCRNKLLCSFQDAAIDLTKKVLGSNHGHNGIEIGSGGGQIFIDKKWSARRARDRPDRSVPRCDTIHADSAPHSGRQEFV